MPLPKQTLLGIGCLLAGVGLLAFSPITGALQKNRLQTAVSQANTNANANTLEHCKVLKVFDGDTFACDLNHNGQLDGKPEHVRMLGIDAPEMHYSRKNHTGVDQPGALAAMTWLSDQTLNKTVYLVRDVNPTDRYGRILAHVFLPGKGGALSAKSLNQQLLALGYARLLFIAPNQAYRQAYQAAAQTNSN
jgi:endonuclease YncB( thermonuclease family)